MRVLMVETGKPPYVTELKGDLKSMQEAVGGYIEGCDFYDDPVAIVCNENGKVDGLPLNRAIYGANGQMVDVIVGNFFVAGMGKDDFTDLPDEYMKKYSAMFKCPEEFVFLNGKLTAIPMQVQEQIIEPKRIFVDMDGTLAVFNPIAKIEELYEQEYFLNLAPQQNVVDAVKLLCADSRFEVYILSSALDSPYAINEKNQWLDTYLPQIDKQHRLFPAYGAMKTSIIPDGLKPTDTLLDDYSLNLNSWCPPGQAVKLMNGINGNHGTWQGMKVYSTASAQQIAEVVSEYALNGEQFAQAFECAEAQTVVESIAEMPEAPMMGM